MSPPTPGLDYIGTFALIASLLAETRRIAFFPDVANLPLRPPAVMAKMAAGSGRFRKTSASRRIIGVCVCSSPKTKILSATSLPAG